MEPTSIQLSRYHLALAPVLVSNIFLPESFQNDSGHCKGDSRVYNSNKCRVYARYGGLLKWGTPKSSKLDHFTSIETMVLGISLKTHLYIYTGVVNCESNFNMTQACSQHPPASHHSSWRRDDASINHPNKLC